VNATPGRKDPSRQLLEAEDNRRLVREAFRPWEEGDSGPFFDLVAEDVRWTVIGTTSVSGVFESKQALSTVPSVRSSSASTDPSSRD
jgi:ketosteroid isomerase-like protein